MQSHDTTPFPFAPQGASAAPHLGIGTVCGRVGAWLFVRGAEGEQRAQVAPSCLLVPEDGDVVLLCFTPGLPVVEAAEGMALLPCHSHILAVLARTEPAHGTLQLPGGARLAAHAGDLRIEGRQVDIAASAGLHADAPQLSVDATRGDLRFGHVNASAGGFIGVIGELRLVARNLHSQVGRLVQKVRDSFREVEQLDELRAGRTRWEVEGHAQLHGRQVTLLADAAVKIDGQRVDLG